MKAASKSLVTGCDTLLKCYLARLGDKICERDVVIFDVCLYSVCSAFLPDFHFAETHVYSSVPVDGAKRGIMGPMSS